MFKVILVATDGSVHPTQRILEYADREDADLIVLGRRGLGSFAELMGGSVSHKVTHATDRSCLTVK